MSDAPDLHRLASLRRQGDADESTCRTELEAAGFDDGRSATEALDQILAHDAEDAPAEAVLPACGASADPGRALYNLTRLLPLDERPPIPVPLPALTAFLGASQHMADLLVARPELLGDLGAPFDAEGAPQRYVDAGASPDRENALRRAQQRDLLSIAWRDLIDGADVERITAMLSLLADAAVTGAARGLGADAHFAIIALGKLGGYELNYSSDIDLLFVRPDDMTDGVHADRIATELVRLIGRQTREGHLYRVDMRLRPEGSAGQLTRRLASSMDYYRTRGRPWERQMLTKARVVCEADGSGREFVGQTRAWILECGLDAASVRQFKRLKVATEARAAGGAKRVDIKQSPGGIRDVETLVQFLALQHAAQNPSLVTVSTLKSLERLRTSGALSSLEAARLRSAYRHHRRVENLLQVMHRLQTHRLPADRTHLARLMHARDADTFGDELGEHMRRVREIFDRHFTRAFEDLEGPSALIAEMVLDPRLDEDRARAALGDLGFKSPAASLEVLRRAAAPGSRFLPVSPRLRSAFANAVPRLLEQLALMSDPDAALDRFERMTQGVGAREVLYSQLAAEPQLATMLCDLAGGSPHLADLLAHEPALFDGFVDGLLTGVRGQKDRRAGLDTIGDHEAGDPWLVLSDHRKQEMLRIGVRDLTNLTPTRQTLSELSQLCIDVLRHAFDVALSRAEREHGRPITIRGMSRKEAAGMAVVAMGKVGGLEANYASDADLVFVYSGDGETEGGLANKEFFTRVAEEFIARVGGGRDTPRLYKVDTRLRPEGSKGPLVTSLRAFEAYYQSSRAALFEFQSLLKARVVAGDAELGQQLQALVRKIVRNHDYPDDLADHFRDMRAKIEATARGHDLKRGTGGLVDVEFVTQYLQLRHGRRSPSILVQETPRALQILADHELLRPHAAQRLIDSYFFFRRVETRLQIAMGLDTKEIPSEPAAARSLALRLGYADTAEGDAAHQLLVDLEEITTKTRQQFEQLLA